MEKNISFCAFADEASSKLCGQITALRRNGLELLEIRGVDGKNIAEITADEAKEIRKRLDSEGIRVWSSGSPIGKVDIHLDFAAELERLNKELEAANKDKGFYENKLNNPGFVAKAPEAVVNQQRELLAKTLDRIALLEESISKIKSQI